MLNIASKVGFNKLFNLFCVNIHTTKLDNVNNVSGNNRNSSDEEIL